MSNGHFGTSAEMSWVRSVLGPKCPKCPFTRIMCVNVGSVKFSTVSFFRCKNKQLYRIFKTYTLV